MLCSEVSEICLYVGCFEIDMCYVWFEVGCVVFVVGFDNVWFVLMVDLCVLILLLCG